MADDLKKLIRESEAAVRREEFKSRKPVAPVKTVDVPVKKVNTKKAMWPDRTCLVCQYKGEMKTWFGYNGPQFIALVLLFCYVVPGLIFIAWGWGKYKCPKCGALAKNVPAEG